MMVTNSNSPFHITHPATRLLVAVVCTLSGFINAALHAQQVTITPEYPQRLQQVTITYKPLSGNDTVRPVLVFPHSNFYEMPPQMPMAYNAGLWTVSFPLQRYAGYADFFIKHGRDTIKPVNAPAYPLIVYTAGKKPVKGSYLFQSKIAAEQAAKNPNALQERAALLKKELALYPENFEARVLLYQNNIKLAPAAEKETIKREAYDFVNKTFAKDPVANMNLGTMGFIILGDNHTDSIYRVVKERFPHTAQGTEFRISDLAKIKDTLARVAALEAEIAHATPLNEAGLDGAHKMLFRYYVQKNDTTKALIHAGKMFEWKMPYLPGNLLSVAQSLAMQSLASDTALKYAFGARMLADSFPAGLILYFRETGHIPIYVPEQQRRAAKQKAYGNIYAAIALIYANKGDTGKMQLYNDSALLSSTDAVTLEYTATALERLGKYDQAYDINKRNLVLADFADSLLWSAARINFSRWKTDTTGWEQERSSIAAKRSMRLMNDMRQSLLNKPAPPLDGMVDMQGRPVLADTLAGKVVLIDFWATWCVPCMQEMPWLQKVYDRYKHNKKVAFMVVNSGSANTLTDAQNWFGNRKYSFPVYFHTNKTVAASFGFTSIPSIFVIDKEGKLQYKHSGFEGPQVEERLASLLDLLLK